MSSTTPDDLGLGDGIYTVPQVARILAASSGNRTVSERRVRSWSRRADTFRLHGSSVGTEVLSFLDLVSLEVVTRLVNKGVRFSRIRQTERSLRQLFPNLAHPFATQIFFTDGNKVWIDYQRHRMEVGGYPMQYVDSEAHRPFVTQVSFDSETGLAVRWDVNEWTEINPKVQFGQPVVRGTRVPVSTVLANLNAGSPEQVADWYGLDVSQVVGVRDFALAT